MKKIVLALTASAFLATASYAPASAHTPPPPLPAIGIWPAMIIFGAKENKKFKAVNPYAKKAAKKSKKKKG